MKKGIIALLLIVVSLTTLTGATHIGNATLGGVTGYIVLPSALPVASGHNPTITTGYSTVFNVYKDFDFSHIPYLQVGLKEDFELGVSVDVKNNDTNLMLHGKWRFIHKGDISITLGVGGDLIDLVGNFDWAANAYIASTFNSSFFSLPSTTTFLVGYTFSDDMRSNIDFGMGFEAPLWEKGFKGKVNFLIDFGNISYSARPLSGGNADNRGLFNIGMRLLPTQIMKSTFITAELRAIDIFDEIGRALSAGVSISFQP